jgi:hypothetical protein
MSLQTLVKSRKSAIRGVAGNVDELALLPADRARLRRSFLLDRIPAVAALPERIGKLGFGIRHDGTSFPYFFSRPFTMIVLLP